MPATSSIHPAACVLPVQRLLSQTWSALLSFTVACALYFYTLAPDVAVSDFAEFQYLPARLGLAHPSGITAHHIVRRSSDGKRRLDAPPWSPG